MKRLPWLWIALLATASVSTAQDAGRIAVGSKNFAESRLLGEVFAQLIEARTELEVERRLGLAGTEFCFEALRSGAIDLYPEYTGTGLVTLLGEPPGADAAEALRTVRREFLRRYDLQWLGPLGFENAYELAVPEALAEREGLRTISDLVVLAPGLRAGFGNEFVERDDGLPGLAETYGLEFGSVETLLEAPKYQAIKAGALDVLDVYTTDGRLLVYDLRVLEDDRSFFPPYQAAALIRGQTLRRHPEIATALALLAGALDGARMRQLNLRLQEEHEPVERVARDLLLDLGILPEASAEAMRLERSEEPVDGGLFLYLWRQRSYLLRLTLQHLGLSAAGLALGILVALPLGLWLERRSSTAAESVIRVIGTSQTIPSLALLGFLIPFLGIGVTPTIVALWLYAIFPILRNSYSGLRDASPEAVEAATALGMTPGQVLARVRLPLAIPTIMAGIRTAAVITVGTATLAAFIGAGGLGEPIISGVQLVDSRRILSGALPAALLALIVDAALGGVERLLRPRGL